MRALEEGKKVFNRWASLATGRDGFGGFSYGGNIT